MRYKQVKKFYKRYEVMFIVSVIIFAFISAAAIGRLQTSFSTSGIWDASAEIGGVSINGQYIDYSTLAAIEKSKNKVSWDPDGIATSFSSMSSAGLMPQVEVTVGALFHVNKVGLPITATGPNEIEDIDGVRYVRYYLGFSISLLTRGSHLDLSTASLDFDYYGQNIHLYENPNFASVNLAGDIGIELAKTDDTVPTVCGVQSFKLLDYETRYTTATGQGYTDDISDFNREYDWETYSHKGSVSAPSEYEIYSYYGLDAEYSGRVDLESTLIAGSEYAPTWSYGYMAGGTFNVWDVELLAHFMCEVLLTYEIAADVDGYLEGRLDIGGIAEPEVYDIFYYISLFIANILGYIMDIFGLSNIWVALAVLIGLLIAAVIVMIMVKKIMFGGVKMSVGYG